MVTVLYFAGLRESLACSREQVALSAPTATVASLIDQLRARGEKWSEAFAPGRNFRVAVNQQMAEAATPVKDSDEIAFFPPVTGG